MPNLINLSIEKGQKGIFFVSKIKNQLVLCFKTNKELLKIAEFQVPKGFIYEGEITLSDENERKHKVFGGNNIDIPFCMYHKIITGQFSDRLSPVTRVTVHKSEGNSLSRYSALSQTVVARTTVPKKQLRRINRHKLNEIKNPYKQYGITFQKNNSKKRR